MALTPSFIQSALLANRVTGPLPFFGPNFDKLALGLGLGIFQWAVSQPANLALTGAATGLVGAGVIVSATSKLIVPPQVNVVHAALVGAGVAGPLSSSMSIVIANGVSQAFTLSGQYTGPVGGVGVGADVSKVTVANAPALAGILMVTLSSVMGAGPSLGMLTAGLGVGIASLLLLGAGTGVVAGSPSYPTVSGSVPTFSTVV